MSYKWEAMVEDLTVERDRLRNALKYILWVKDCGIDGTNEKGEFVNWSAQERDEMYKIAKTALNEKTE
mgnify:CR=1 FL=1